MPNSASVTVVIISHNGGDRIQRTLFALREQTLQWGSFDVVVVDDGSEDNTADVAAGLGAEVVRLGRNLGPGAARAAGAVAARGAIVAFVDDDCVPEPSWLERLLAPFEEPDVDAVGGSIVPAARDTLVTAYFRDHNPWSPLSADLLRSASRRYRLMLYLRSLLAGTTEPTGDALFAVSGANMAFRAEVLASVGGFDATRSVGEETDLCWRLHRRPGGARIVYRRDARVAHSFDPAIGDVLRRARWYGQAQARIARTHGELNLVVYPAPVLLSAFALLATRRLEMAAGLVLAPLLSYPGWARLAARRRSLVPVCYPYLQLALEVSTMLGEADVVARRGACG